MHCIILQWRNLRLLLLIISTFWFVFFIMLSSVSPYLRLVTHHTERSIVNQEEKNIMFKFRNWITKIIFQRFLTFHSYLLGHCESWRRRYKEIRTKMFLFHLKFFSKFHIPIPSCHNWIKQPMDSSPSLPSSKTKNISTEFSLPSNFTSFSLIYPLLIYLVTSIHSFIPIFNPSQPPLTFHNWKKILFGRGNRWTGTPLK